MFQTNLWCYLWDLVDEGVDDVLDRLKGEAGATGISVATSYHSVDQLRPHAGVKPRTFRSPGGAQFQPHAAAYAGTRMRPVVATWLKKSNPLATVADACAKRGLKLRGWTVCCHSSVTVGRHADCSVKDVLGDPYPTWLCPINPDVREYLRAMVEDLTEHYHFDTIELERPSFDAHPHSHAHHKIGFALGEVGRWLYNLCFCESCRQAAKRNGVDAEAAARSAKVTLERLFTDGTPIGQPLDEFVANDPMLRAYVDWRCEQVTSLVRSIKQSCRGRVVVHRAGERYQAATDWPAIAGVCDGLLRNCPYPDRQGVMEAVVREVFDDTSDMAGVELGFNACTPPCPDSETFVGAVSHAARLGVRSVNVYNYGMLPLNRMDWIRRASRYAQREAE